MTSQAMATWVQALKPPSGAGPGSMMWRLVRRVEMRERALLAVRVSRSASFSARAGSEGSMS